jgi:leucyl aminopeptidase
MTSPLPPEPSIRITQSTKAPVLKDYESVDQLIVLLPERPGSRDWNALPKGARLRKLAGRRGKDAAPAVVSRLDNKAQTGVVMGFVSAGEDVFALATKARKLAAAALSEKPARVAILVAGFRQERLEQLVRSQLLAVLLGSFRLPVFRREDPKPSRLSTVRLLGLPARIDIARVQAEAEGNNLARWLTGLPPNVGDAQGLRAVAGELAGRHGWRHDFLDTRELEERGAGAFLAVASGNETDDAGIIRLRYEPADATDPPRIALVGKGIIFDTGGTNLKPAGGMLDMHGDMQGAAVALGTLLALTLLEAPIAVDCWLAVTENRTGPRAYKQQDLVRAANGKTIQVMHTDAEGRMVLADTLTLAGEGAPALILDYATLTGTCISAITTRYSGIFTNRPDLHPLLTRAGEESGERVWPFPVTDEFRDELKSEVADLKQCLPTGAGDHIMAAAFLREFLPEKTDWVHMDLSASNHDGGLGFVGTGVTGFGVRYTLNLLLDQSVLRPGTDA